jgi:hypothetical protein
MPDDTNETPPKLRLRLLQGGKAWEPAAQPTTIRVPKRDWDRMRELHPRSLYDVLGDGNSTTKGSAS